MVLVFMRIFQFFAVLIFFGPNLNVQAENICRKTLNELILQINTHPNPWKKTGYGKMRYGRSFFRPQGYMMYSNVSNGVTSVTRHMPEHVRRLAGDFSTCDGPSCFTLARYYFDPDQKPEYVEFVKMRQWLRENTRNLEADEEPFFEDILAFWSRENVLHHVGVYVGGLWLFHKANYRVDGPIGFERFGAFARRYEAPWVSVHRHKSRPVKREVEKDLEPRR